MSRALWRLTGAELSCAASGPIGERTTAEPMSSFPHSSKKFGAQNYAIEAAPDSSGLQGVPTIVYEFTFIRLPQLRNDGSHS